VAQLKSELQLLEKNDVSMLKAETDRLAYDLEKLRQRLREDIARTQSGVRLDLNLEKGRMREDVGGQELKIKEVDARIEQEIANLRTAIQQSKVCCLLSSHIRLVDNESCRPRRFNISSVSVCLFILLRGHT
jgi:hypothetical protein